MGVTSGWTAPGFEHVQDVFEAGFTTGTELGAAFARLPPGSAGGRPVGRDRRRGDRAAVGRRHDRRSSSRPRRARRRSAPTSSPRRVGSTSTRRWSRYWPEFGKNGKEDIPVVTCSRTRPASPGSTASSRSEEALSWEPVIDALGEPEPPLGPGTAARLPRHHLRLARRRGHPPRRRPHASARTSATRSPSRSASTSGSACPRRREPSRHAREHDPGGPQRPTSSPTRATTRC